MHSRLLTLVLYKEAALNIQTNVKSALTSILHINHFSKLLRAYLTFFGRVTIPLEIPLKSLFNQELIAVLSTRLSRADLLVFILCCDSKVYQLRYETCVAFHVDLLSGGGETFLTHAFDKAVGLGEAHVAQRKA